MSLVSKQNDFLNSLKVDTKVQKAENEESKSLRNYFLYNSFIENRYYDFSAKRKIIFRLLTELIESGEIGKDIQVISRIKSYYSAMKNEQRGKKLDDIFGTRILAETHEELETIQQHITETARILKIKAMDKSTSGRTYKAIHVLADFDSDGTTLPIEIHLQTQKEHKEKYPHMEYKLLQDENLGKSQLVVLAAKGVIQQMYDKKDPKLKLFIPYMWNAEYKDDINTFYEKQLGDNDVLREMYPFIRLESKPKKETIFTINKVGEIDEKG